MIRIPPAQMVQVLQQVLALLQNGFTLNHWKTGSDNTQGLPSGVSVYAINSVAEMHPCFAQKLFDLKWITKTGIILSMN